MVPACQFIPISYLFICVWIQYASATSWVMSARIISVYVSKYAFAVTWLKNALWLAAFDFYQGALWISSLNAVTFIGCKLLWCWCSDVSGQFSTEYAKVYGKWLLCELYRVIRGTRLKRVLCCLCGADYVNWLTDLTTRPWHRLNEPGLSLGRGLAKLEVRSVKYYCGESL